MKLASHLVLLVVAFAIALIYVLKIFSVLVLREDTVAASGSGHDSQNNIFRIASERKALHSSRRYASLENANNHTIQTEVFIGVNLGVERIELARSIVDTWGSVFKNDVTVGFFACPAIRDNATLPFLFTYPDYPCLEYPPMESWRITFQTMTRFTRVKWFVKCDDDSYVNVRALLAFLRNLTQYGVHPDGFHYFGSPGYGREKVCPLLIISYCLSN
jgi:hypothetical protein